MKRILSLVLILILSIGVLCACQLFPTPTTPTTPTTPSTTEPTPTEPVHNCKYDVNKAKNYLNSLYVGWLDNNATSVAYTVATLVPVGSDRYTVEWTVDNDAITITPDDMGIEATVSVPALGAQDVPYTLTGVITAPDGCTAEISYELKVPALALNTHEEYMAAKEGDVLQVAGIVVAINSKEAGNKYNHVFLADLDGKGGYYCYSVTEDPATLGVKVGMTVMVSGPVTPYSGMQEIKGGEVIILDETIKEVAPVDITDKFTEGADLGALVGMPVVIKGVEIGTQDLEKDTSQYLYFSIGEKTGYVRTYVTDFPVGMLTADDKATIDADHAAHFGYKADVAGILILYSGNPYLIPMSVTPFTNYVEVEKTPAEKVESEKETTSVSTSFAADAVVTLPLVGKNYPEVTISWVSDNAAIVIAEDGTATITVPDTKTVVKLTATFVCGEATATKEIEVTLNKKALTAGEAIEIGAAKEHNTYTDGKYLIAGVITEVYNETYGNMKITDEFGNVLTVYGTYSADGSVRYDAMETKPVVGDYVVLLGVLGQYNGTAQTKNAWILSWTSPTSIPDANTTGAAKDHNTYTEEKHLITGTVTEVVNTTYGNLYIEDAEGNKLYIYGLYDQLGNRYDKMTKAPAVGDVITILSVLGQYNSNPQAKNATLVAHTVATTETPHEHTFVEGKCECGETDPNYVPPSEGGNTGDDTTEPVMVTTPEVGVAYDWALNQENLSKFLYFAGTVSSDSTPWYFATATDATASVKVYLEAVEGGYHLYFMNGTTKTYIRAYERNADEGKGSMEFTTTAPTEVYTWNSEHNTLVLTVGSNSYYIGTYGTYNTLSCSNLSYISTSYPSHFYTEGVVDDDNTGDDVTPPAGDNTTVVGDSVTLNFSEVSTNKGSELNADSALTLFNAAAGSNVLTSVGVTKAYDGNGTGGAYPSSSGFIKMGTGSVAGQLVLNFGENKVTKVEIKCHDWYKKSDSHPTNSNKVSVNGSTPVLAPYTTDGTAGVLTFDLTESSSTVTIDSNLRIFIFEIIVYFE